MGEKLFQTTKLPEEQPKMAMLLLIGMLFHNAGQHTFTIHELAELEEEFDGIRFFHNVPEDSITVTIHRRK
jgi:hypothetical protein